jgi:hypothetical protein
MKPNNGNNSSLDHDETLPRIHIMAGGIHALVYARFAAECVWHSCPDELRKELRIVISVFAVPKHLVAETYKFLEAVPCVSILLNPVKVPLRLFNLPRGFARDRIGKLLAVIRKGLERSGLPPKIQISLCPQVHKNLSSYLHEYVIRICDLESDRKRICILDADFFVWDKSFVPALAKTPSQEVFSSAWIQRSGDGAILKDKVYYPVGSECFTLNPQNFNRWNWQVETIDKPLLKVLKSRHPGMQFQREMVDTVYQACWEAQIGGMTVDYPFRDIKVCHIGGFGHSNVKYIQDCLKSGVDGEGRQTADFAGAQFWVQRIRLNERVAAEFAIRYPLPWIVSGLGPIRTRAEAAWVIPEIRELRDKTPLSNDEILFNKIVSEIGR